MVVVDPYAEIKRMVFSSLLSLAVFGIATTVIDWGCEKCPFDTKKTKMVVMVVIAIIAFIVLTRHFRTVQKIKSTKYSRISPSANRDVSIRS